MLEQQKAVKLSAPVALSAKHLSWLKGYSGKRAFLTILPLFFFIALFAEHELLANKQAFSQGRVLFSQVLKVVSLIYLGAFILSLLHVAKSMLLRLMILWRK